MIFLYFFTLFRMHLEMLLYYFLELVHFNLGLGLEIISFKLNSAILITTLLSFNVHFIQLNSENQYKPFMTLFPIMNLS